MNNISQLIDLWDFETKLFTYEFEIPLSKKDMNQGFSLEFSFLNRFSLYQTLKVYLLDKDTKHVISNYSNIKSLVPEKSGQTLKFLIEFDLSNISKNSVFELTTYYQMFSINKDRVIFINEDNESLSDLEKMVRLMSIFGLKELAQTSCNNKEIFPIFKMIIEKDIQYFKINQRLHE